MRIKRGQSLTVQVPWNAPHKEATNAMPLNTTRLKGGSAVDLSNRDVPAFAART